jgi:hypothetical protein
MPWRWQGLLIVGSPMQMLIFVVQICTLALLLGLVGRDFFSDFIKMLPAIIIGTFVESLFRRLVLLLLLIAGATHSIHAVAERPVSQGADRSKVCFAISPNAVTLRRDGGWYEHTGTVYSPGRARHRRIQTRRIGAIENVISNVSIATATTLDRTRGADASLVDPPAQPLGQAPRPRSEAAGGTHQIPEVPSRRTFLPAG